MMKVSLGKVQAHIELNVGVEGSVLAQTIKARADKIVIRYDIESDEEPAKLAGLIRNARNGCYVRQTIGNPEIFDDSITLNGEPFDLDATGIIAGSLDAPTGLKTMGHIFVAEKSDFYEITDGMPQYEGPSGGELLNDY